MKKYIFIFLGVINHRNMNYISYHLLQYNIYIYYIYIYYLNIIFQKDLELNLKNIFIDPIFHLLFNVSMRYLK